MNMLKYCLIIILLFLSGCRKVDINREFIHLKDSTQCMTGFDIAFRPVERSIDLGLSKLLFDEGVSRNQAIGIALMHNPQLQANFETLGIAKADLEQAGLYTNPDIHGFFWPPLQNSHMELETGAFFTISDLWQVPLRKNIQKDVLERVTFKILESVLEIMKEARMAYDKVLIAQKQLEIHEDIARQSIDLRDNIYYRQGYGLSSDLDKYFADVMVSNARLDVIRIQNELSQAYIYFKKTLGIAPTPEPIKLTERLDKQVESFNELLPSLEKIQDIALTSRPEILNAHMKIKQFKDTIKLEKASVFRTVNAGVSFQGDFDGSKGLGPSLEFSLPVFDQNHAQIARAEFLLEQAKKELVAIQLEIQKEIQNHYLDFINFQKEIAVYNTDLLPASEKALAYVNQYETIMQVTMVTVLQTKTTLYQNKVKFVEVYFNALNAFSQLERAIGKRIDLLN